MKKRIFNYVIVLSILTFSVTIVAQESDFDPYKLEVEYFSNKKIIDKYVFSDKKGNTFRIKNSDYNKGLYIKYDGKFLKHGVFYSMSNGRITNKVSYYYGKKHGEYLSYHSNTKVNFQRNYDNDKIVGKWYQYNDKEKLVEEREYVNGLEEGTRLSYHANKEINFKSTYINGLREGVTLQYNDNGKLISKTNYKNGNRVGKTKWLYD